MSHRWKILSPAAVAATLAAIVGCGDPVPVGGVCADTSECAADLQCLEGICTPTCRQHTDCGDGYRCEDDGTCTLVVSQIGQGCQREIECGPGQFCRLDDTDANGNGLLGASCQSQRTGAGAGSACEEDADCRQSTCALSRCTLLCVDDSDCPEGLACSTVPRLLDGSAPLFRGCLPAAGVVEHSIPVDAPESLIRIAVPSHARSFAMVAKSADPNQFVGATSLTSPSGQTLYRLPSTPEQFYANRIRYQPTPAISTLFVPNTPRVELEVGAYEARVSSMAIPIGVGTAVPEITVYYKLDDSAILDLNFYFLNLGDDPCTDSPLSAESAVSSTEFQDEFLESVREILRNGGIVIGAVSYSDILDRPDLDGLSSADLGALLQLGTSSLGVNVFFVRSIDPVGIQALSGGIPGPPRTPGSRASGVVVATDTLCYRSWSTLARVTSHALAKQMGLFRNREPDGNQDPIADSDLSTDNLMYFGEFGGATLSEGQRAVLRRYPGLR